MHKALLINEIQHEICSYLHQDDAVNSLVSLAKTCTSFSVPLSYAWKCINEEAIFALADALNADFSDSDRIALYMRTVQKVYVNIQDKDQNRIARFATSCNLLSTQTTPQPIFPSMNTLFLTTDSPNPMKQSIKLLCSKITVLNIEISASHLKHVRIWEQIFPQFLTLLVEKSIQLRKLVLGCFVHNFDFGQALSDVLHVMPNMEEISINTSLLSVTVLHQVISLRHLQTLALDTNEDFVDEILPILTDSTIEPKFDCLRILKLDIDVGVASIVLQVIQVHLVELQLHCYVSVDTTQLPNVIQQLAIAIAEHHDALCKLSISIEDENNRTSFEALDPIALVPLKRCYALQDFTFDYLVMGRFLLCDDLLGDLSNEWPSLKRFALHWFESGEGLLNARGAGLNDVHDVSIVGLANLTNNCPSLELIDISHVDFEDATTFPILKDVNRPLHLYIEAALFDNPYYPAIILNKYWLALDVSIMKEEHNMQWSQVLSLANRMKVADAAIAQYNVAQT